MRLTSLHLFIIAAALFLFSSVSGPSMAAAYLGQNFVFATESVPISQTEVYEALDQELLLISEAKARVYLCLRRSPRTLPIVEKALKDAGVPSDFKYFPMALTSLDPNYRLGKRLGIWRLSEEEAKATGLIVDKSVDERLDPEASSIAAAKLLKAYKERYGSWAMALAALIDPQALSQAVDEAGGEANYFNLYVPEALDKTLSTVLAGKILFSNPAAYGYNLSKSWPALATNRIKLSKDETMSDLALKYSVDYKTFRDMNTHILSDSAPSGTFLNIP
jgi:hypothetical protein